MKKIISFWALFFIWLNSTFAEVWWTITRSISNTSITTTSDGFKKYSFYDNKDEFLRIEWQSCQVATDSCNTIQINNWKFWWSTRMLCMWENGEEFKPKYSCLKYVWEMSQADKSQYDAFVRLVDKQFLSNLDKIMLDFDSKLQRFWDNKKHEIANNLVNQINDVLMEQIHLKYPQDKALPPRANDLYLKLTLFKLRLSVY